MVIGSANLNDRSMKGDGDSVCTFSWYACFADGVLGNCRGCGGYRHDCEYDEWSACQCPCPTMWLRTTPGLTRVRCSAPGCPVCSHIAPSALQRPVSLSFSSIHQRKCLTPFLRAPWFDQAADSRSNYRLQCQPIHDARP